MHFSATALRLGSFLCAILVLGASCIKAQDSPIPSRLTLDEAVRLAMDRNPALAAVKNEIQEAEGNRIAAGKRPNPSFSLQFEDLPISAHPGSLFSVQEITSRIDYEIERGERRRLRTEAAHLSLEAKKLVYRDRVRRMRLQVERIFYQTVLAKSNLEASNLILDEVERMIALNRVRFQQGDISALDLSRIEVEKLKFQDDVFQSDLALRNAESSLLALLNAPDLSQEVDVIGALPVDYANPEPGLAPGAPLHELIRIALRQRPDLAALRREIARADTEKLLQRAIRLPNVTVGGGYKRNLTDNAVVFGISIPLKIFNRNEGEIMRADAEQMQAVNLAAAAEKEVQLEVQKAFNAVEINRRRVDYIRTQLLRRAEEASRVTLESYNLGDAALVDYLDAQRTYRDALRNFNQALFDERISLCELSSAIASGVQ